MSLALATLLKIVMHSASLETCGSMIQKETVTKATVLNSLLKALNVATKEATTKDHTVDCIVMELFNIVQIKTEKSGLAT